MKSQVSEMAKDLDGQVEAFRTRPLDAGPYTFVAADALVLKVREGGRTVNVHALLAVGVNSEGYREILGLHVTSAEDGAGWLGFFCDLTARGLSGVALVTSDAHRGLVEAIGATLPGTSWQRCRTRLRRQPDGSYPEVGVGLGESVCCIRSMTSPTPTRCTPSSTASSTRYPTSCRLWRRIWMPPGPTSWRSPPSQSGLAADLVQQPRAPRGATAPWGGETPSPLGCRSSLTKLGAA